MKQTSLLQSWTHTNHLKSASSSTSDHFVDKRTTLTAAHQGLIGTQDDETDDHLITHALDKLCTSPSYNETGSLLASLNRLHEHRASVNYRRTGNDASHLEGFDSETGKTWIYPVSPDHTVRNYQLNIVEQCLYKNTLVCLPTGLGKTFIAAVVLYNYLRWYPTGKVIFMAPTRPLVSQQFNACRQILIPTATAPSSLSVELTGSIPQAVRQKIWSTFSGDTCSDPLKKQPRALFMTPQILTNDLQNGICPAKDVRLLIFDEAHKASGNHAYCQVIRLLTSAPYCQRQFRIIALSATPAADIQGVQGLIANLLISHLELRSEDSPELSQFIQDRQLETVIVPLGTELLQFKDKILNCLRLPVERLQRIGALPTSSIDRIDHLAKYSVVKAREVWTSSPHSRATGLAPNASTAVQSDFGIVICLLHALELLEQHGLRPVYHYLSGVLHGQRASALVRSELSRLPSVQQLLVELSTRFTDSPIGAGSRVFSTQSPFQAGHPKLAKLKEILVNHFESEVTSVSAETRAIVFSQFRDSVDEIMHMLKQLRPRIRPASFIGQSSSVNRNAKAGRSGSTSDKDTDHSPNLGSEKAITTPITATAGISQRDQLRVMNAFRTGVFNVLVSTCVGEEGIDVGQVDLIICFDAHKSPIRLMQRLGRTGRRRIGRIVMLLTEGREEHNHAISMVRKSSISRALQVGEAYRQLAFYPHNPRMVPLGVEPKLTFQSMAIAEQLPLDSLEMLTHKVAQNSNGKTFDRYQQGSRSVASKPTNNYQAILKSHVESTGLEHLQLRLHPTEPSPLISLSIVNNSENRLHSCITTMYNVNGTKRLINIRKQIQARLCSPIRGPATSSLHLVSLLRLTELHRRGRTQLLYHALGLRGVDSDGTMVEEDEECDVDTVDIQSGHLLLNQASEDKLVLLSQTRTANNSKTRESVGFRAKDIVPIKHGLISKRVFFADDEPIHSSKMSMLEQAIDLLSYEPQLCDKITENSLKEAWTDWLLDATPLTTDNQEAVTEPVISTSKTREFKVDNLSDWIDASMFELLGPLTSMSWKPTTPQTFTTTTGTLALSERHHYTTVNKLASVEIDDGLVRAFCLPAAKQMLSPSDSSTPKTRSPSHINSIKTPKVTLDGALALLDRSSLQLETSNFHLDSQIPVTTPICSKSSTSKRNSALFTTGLVPPSFDSTSVQFGTRLALSDDFSQDLLMPTQAPSCGPANVPVAGEPTQHNGDQSPDLSFSSQINWSPLDVLHQGTLSDETISPHSPKTAIRTQDGLYQLNVTSESPLAPLKRRAKQHDQLCELLQTQVPKENGDFRSTPISKRQKNRRYERASQFLLTQAEHNSELTSFDSDASDLDAYESSFIADGSPYGAKSQLRYHKDSVECAPTGVSQSAMMAIYLQSIRSPNAVSSRFSRAKRVGGHLCMEPQHAVDTSEVNTLRSKDLTNIYSQSPIQDDEYQLDSFCVDDVEEFTQLDCTEEDCSPLSPVRRRRRLRIDPT